MLRFYGATDFLTLLYRSTLMATNKKDYVVSVFLKATKTLNLLLISWIIIITGCASSKQFASYESSAITSIAMVDSLYNQAPAVSKRDRTYTIGPFDRLQITVWFDDELSREYLVKEDGTISIPGIGYIRLEGLTLREAQESLKRQMRKILIQPELDIEPVLVQSKTYYILGAVARPGQYPIFRETDIPSAIALAGGSSPTGMLNCAYLRRGDHTYLINIRSLLLHPAEPTWLSKGDVLYIPDQQDRRVYVLGYVARPGPVDVAGTGLDLLAAVSAAGGFVPGAQRTNVIVLRRGADHLLSYIVNLRQALKSDVEHLSGLLLEPGDIVYVPQTALGSINETMELITPMLSLLVFEPLAAGRDYFLMRDLIRRPN